MQDKMEGRFRRLNMTIAKDILNKLNELVSNARITGTKLEWYGWKPNSSGSEYKNPDKFHGHVIAVNDEGIHHYDNGASVGRVNHDQVDRYLKKIHRGK
jgi:hypothetical protein